MTAIQKKVCMVGVFGTGKTSLVQQFVYSRFSEKYHSTVGVKIDRKEVVLPAGQVNLLIWDLAGQDGSERIRGSYLRGSSGLVFVVDGTRPETVTELVDLRGIAGQILGDVPSVIAFNKADLESEWRVSAGSLRSLEGEERLVLKTSAKTGAGVNEAFAWLADRMTRS